MAVRTKEPFQLSLPLVAVQAMVNWCPVVTSSATETWKSLVAVALPPLAFMTGRVALLSMKESCGSSQLRVTVVLPVVATPPMLFSVSVR